MTPKFPILLLSLSATVLAGCHSVDYTSIYEPYTIESAPEGTKIVIDRTKERFYADMQVNGKTINCLIDTGGFSLSLGNADAEKLGFNYSAGLGLQTGLENSVYGHNENTWTSYNRVIDSFSWGELELSNVSSRVWNGTHYTCILGTHYMKIFNRITIRGKQMVLSIGNQKPIIYKKPHKSFTIKRASHYIENKLKKKIEEEFAQRSSGRETRFTTILNINGTNTECLIDTGDYGSITLGKEPIKQIGMKIDFGKDTGKVREYPYWLPITLDSIKWGQGAFEDENVDATYFDTEGWGCTLGIKYLETFDDIVIEGDKMTFVRY